jgi:hypothetical protein
VRGPGSRHDFGKATAAPRVYFDTGGHALRDPDEPDPVRAVLAILILLDLLVIVLKI